jgi:hypothetical protein
MHLKYAGFLIASTAWAVPVTYSFTGTADAIIDSLTPFPLPFPSAPFSGTLTFDNATPDQDPGTNGEYQIDPPFSITVEVVGNELTATDFKILIFNDDEFGIGDALRVITNAPAIAGNASVNFFLQDASAGVFSSDQLSNLPTSLNFSSLFTQNSFSLFGFPGDGDLMISDTGTNETINSFVCTSGCATVVVEPGTLTLLALGALMLLRIRA